ncbi:MAG: nucleoside triphosphate pyrophosphatase [Gemmatimonadales bacterium]
MTQTPRLVLASGSPRRRDVLAQLGLHPDVRPSSVDETYPHGESPAAHVERLARAKAAAEGALQPDALVLAGDTIVVLDGRVLGKPKDAHDAVATLMSLAGRTHEVMSALALAGKHGMVSQVSRASVRFRDFDAATARAYAETGEPLDKAGAYGIQGLGAALIDSIAGDYYCVVGLPVGALLDLLARAGWRYEFGRLIPAS